MDWLKELLKDVPMDKISDWLFQVIQWWDKVTANIADDDLPLYAYLGGSALALVALLFIIRVLPRTFGQILWLFAVAVLLTPEGALEGSGFAPAIASVAHGVLMKDYSGAAHAFSGVLFVFVVLLLLAAIWQMMRGVIEVNVAKRAEAKQIQAEKEALANAQNSDNA